MMKLKSGYPFWLIRNGLMYEYPLLEQDARADVLIIGAGISGAISAYFLTLAGFRCIVVDERSVGLGSTCASTSLLQYELDTPLHKLKEQVGDYDANRSYILCGEAIDIVEEICRKISCTGFMRRPSLYYAAYKKDAQLIEQEWKARKAAEFDVELLDAAELGEQFGFGAANAILSAQGACLDAYSFTHQLFQHLVKQGLEVFHRTKVDRIDYKKRGVEAHTASGFTIKASKLVNATGYQVLDFIGKRIVKLHSTYAVVSEQLPSGGQAWKQDAMIWNTADPYLYMRKTDDHRIIVGGRDEDFFSAARRDSLLEKKAALLEKDFKRLFPDTKFITEFCWTGTFGSTKDSLPYIGTYAPTPHTYYALGFGGNGITFSVIAAQLIRDAMCGVKNPDRRIFSFDR